MSVMLPELEVVDRATRSIRYLEHGWPSELCRWHAHEEYELHLITATWGKAFVGDYIGEFKAGDLFMTGPNLPHNWTTDHVWSEAVATRDMLVQFSHDSIERLASGFPEFSEVLGLLQMAQSGIKFERFSPTVAREHLLAVRNSKGAERILAFLQLLVRLNQHEQKNTLSAIKLIQPVGGGKHAKIGMVVDHIVKNFADDISVSIAAGMTGMSEVTFSRNFQAVTGHGFVEFVNSVRISQACGMLVASDDQITAICHKAGYKNVANFNRQFLKIKGVSPSSYRETARKELVQNVG